MILRMTGVALVPAVLTWVFPGERKLIPRLFLFLMWVGFVFPPIPAISFVASVLFLLALTLLFPVPRSWAVRLTVGGGALLALGTGIVSRPEVTAVTYLLGAGYALWVLRLQDHAFHRNLLWGMAFLGLFLALFVLEGHALFLLGAVALFLHLGYRDGLFEPEVAFIPSLSRELMTGFPVGLLLTDFQHRVVWENETARNLLAPRKIRGKTLEDLFGAIPLDSRETSYVLTPNNRAYLVWKVPVRHGYVYLLHPVDAFVQSFREVNLKAVQYEKLASLDPLTGVFNRRVLHPLLDELFKRYEAEGIPFSLIMLDLDGFKALNDTYGHETGDQVLKALSSFLRTNLRKSDVVVRYGGDEFVLVLAGTSLQEGLYVASQIKKRWKEVSLPGELNVQFCMGVVDSAHLPRIAEEALRVVDEYLYKAKATGTGMIVSPFLQTES